MKLTSPFLLATILSKPCPSSAFLTTPPSLLQKTHSSHQTRVLTPLHQSNSDNTTERKRDKVRSLLVGSVNKAASLSRSVLNKGGAPIASVLKDAAAEGGGVASEKLVEVLNKIEASLDSIESEMKALRSELLGVTEILGSPSVSVVANGDVAQDLSVDIAAKDDIAPPVAAAADETATTTTPAQQVIDLSTIDLSTLKYEDIDYTLTDEDMAPPFIGEDECLVPGEPVVRVEKAPQNSRRIFAGIDIPVSVDDVWKLLTDYPNLQKVVPNLVVNEVLQLYSGTNDPAPIPSIQSDLSDAEQCREIANRQKGAVLKQVGGAKVVGINFSARTTLEVREWPNGMPDFAHFEDEVYQGKSRSERAKENKQRELARYVFPRPFAVTSLPHKDISMQSIENDDGEFRMYQGVWRMQPLPGCSPPGGSAMRLTYAVEVSPRPYLPVGLVEGRIAADLCNNLKAIREKAMAAA